MIARPACGRDCVNLTTDAPMGGCETRKVHVKMQPGTLTLAVLIGLGAMALPAVSQAGNVGYNLIGGYSDGIPAAITSLGHTPVPVTTLDAASLAGLDVLVLASCGQQTLLNAPNAALNTAVQNGLKLLVETGCSGSSLNSANLPGAPTYSSSTFDAYPEADDIEIPVGAPILTGPGGTLTATSLDRIPAGGSGYYNMVRYHLRSALPAGATVLLTTGNTDHVGALAWSYGSGRVVHTETQSSFFLPGSLAAGAPDSFAPGMVVYFKNLLSWVSGPGAPPTTCASEGYTGTKLTWCKNICEMGYSGATLDMWIHRWVNRYRDLPYCAVEGEEESPPQET